MSSSQVNGDVSHFATLDHLVSYPVINDSIETFKSNSLGQKSLDITHSVYQTFAAPILPLLSRPYQMVKPYVKVADDLGNLALSKVDERFPIVKSSTGELVTGAKALVFLPVRVGAAGKERVFNTYNSEYKKCGGNGSLMNAGKAAVTTSLIITTEALTTLTNFLGAKKDDLKQTAREVANN
ncbi:hypothetical protein B0H66DRAFT_605599 [Apodospora peruviana]|uniref:Perilipin-like protein n=1 Tax=Apodospora peruviana TaxID=516989 RepID=A0AAE0HXZ3_9PEZI|nr:hypothetical protein B0H66DRAFT_605599 [Apodospora peruviana]